MSVTGSLRGLRQFARQASSTDREEVCDLCRSSLPSSHGHLLMTGNDRLLCVCGLCERDRSEREDLHRVPRFARALTGGSPLAILSELGIVSGLAFVNVPFTQAGSPKAQARFPSPTGLSEGEIPWSAWSAVARRRGLPTLTPGIEAILLSRLSHLEACYHLSIDFCYELAGVIRGEWQGIDGGAHARMRVGGFLATLAGRTPDPVGISEAIE